MAGQARHDVVEVRFGTSETGSPKLDRVGRGGTADIQTLKDRSVRSGLVKAQPGRAGRNGQNAEERLPKGRTKRLTFTEGRLRLTTSNASICIPRNALPDLKVRRLGRPCGGPMVLALNFSLHFDFVESSISFKRKGRRIVPMRRRWRA